MAPPGNDASKISRVRFSVLAWLCGAMALAYIARNAIATAESTIRSDLSLSKEQSGWLISAFYLSYALCQLPTSEYARVRGCREALSVFAAVWSAATAAMAAATGLLGLFVTRLIEGISQAGLVPASTMVVARWFPANGRAFATGALGSFMSVGGALGIWFTGMALDRTVGLGWNWRLVLLLSGVPGFVWAIGFWWWFRNQPQDHPSVSPGELSLLAPPPSAGSSPVIPVIPSISPPPPSPSIPWLRLALSPALWWICGQQLCRAAGYMFFTSWFATYLQETRGVGIARSGFLNMLPLLTVVFAGLIGGGLSDWLFRRTHRLDIARKYLGALSLFACAVLIFRSRSIADPLAAVLVISAGSFFAALAAPCAYTITIDLGGDHVPTVNATMNMVGNLGAWAFPIVVPSLLTRFGSWDAVLVLFGSLYIVGAAFWLLLNTSRPILAQSLIHSPHSS